MKFVKGPKIRLEPRWECKVDPWPAFLLRVRVCVWHPNVFFYSCDSEDVKYESMCSVHVGDIDF
jgi:hypothetical protein